MVSRNDEVKRMWELGKKDERTKGLNGRLFKTQNQISAGLPNDGKAWYAFIIYSIVLCAPAICIVSMNVMASVRWARELV